MQARTVVSLIGLVLGCGGVALAQPDPTFNFAKAEELKALTEVKAIEWNATAEAGLVLSTGNSQTTTVTGGVRAMRKEQENKLSIEATGTFARASNLTAQDADANGLISSAEVTRQSATSAKNLASKVRYDRFLTVWDALFAAALAGVDPVAGKDFVGGGQLGYARAVFKTEKHAIGVEGGYDFSYENYVTGPVHSVAIHSARGFVGYDGSLTAVTRLTGSVELLANLNRNAVADVIEDIRSIGKVELSTKITDDISLSVSFTARFDNVPAPAALGGLMSDPASPPTAEKLDTTTKASLIVTLL